MFRHVLNTIIGGRDVLSLTTKEAKKIVSDFYDQIERLTFGQRNQKKIDFLCNEALNEVGLGFLA